MPEISLSAVETVAREIGRIVGPGVLDFAEPDTPFLAADGATLAPGQMHESEFLRATIAKVAETAPWIVGEDEERSVEMALVTLKALTGATGAFISLDALMRALADYTPDQSLDPNEVVTKAAKLLSDQIGSWQLPQVSDPDTLTEDDLKEQWLEGLWEELLDLPAVAAGTAWGGPMPPEIEEHRRKVSTSRTGGSRPSERNFGTRVHTFVQLAYRVTHLTDHVICDNRWYFAGLTVTVSAMLEQMLPAEAAEYYRKIRIFRRAMVTRVERSIRPDITNLSTDEIYEIKARPGAYRAYREIFQYYAYRYNRLGGLMTPPLPLLLGGFWDPPPVYYDIPTKSVALLYNEGHGAIIYDVFALPNAVIESLLATLVSLALLNALGKKLTLLKPPPMFTPPPAIPAAEPFFYWVPVPDEGTVRRSKEIADMVGKGLLIAIGVAVAIALAPLLVL